MPGHGRNADLPARPSVASRGEKRSCDRDVPEDAVARGRGASRPWMACGRALEPGWRSRAMRRTPWAPRLRPELPTPGPPEPSTPDPEAIAPRFWELRLSGLRGVRRPVAWPEPTR